MCECVGGQIGLCEYVCFEDDVASSEHAFVIQGGSLGGLGLWRNVCSLIRVFTSVFFSCALTVNVIGLIYLRQCFILLPPSTETSTSGTSRKLPLCLRVSQCVM